MSPSPNQSSPCCGLGYFLVVHETSRVRDARLLAKLVKRPDFLPVLQIPPIAGKSVVGLDGECNFGFFFNPVIFVFTIEEWGEKGQMV